MNERTDPVLYFFPALRIHVGAIPKTGCTSLLNFLVAAEQATEAGSGRLSHPAFEYPEPQMVHGRQVQDRFSIQPDDPRLADSRVGILTLRDPVDRLLSCWLDKFLLGDPWVARLYYEEAWFPNNFDSLSELRGDFTEFVRSLATDEGLLCADRHWTPQHLLRPQVEFDIHVTTPHLSAIPSLLAGVSEAFAWLEEAEFPAYNASQYDIASQVLTPSAVRLIKRIYKDDTAFCEAAQARFSSAPEPSRPPELTLKHLRSRILATRSSRLYGVFNSLLAERELLLHERQGLLADREALMSLRTAEDAVELTAYNPAK